MTDKYRDYGCPATDDADGMIRHFIVEAERQLMFLMHRDRESCSPDRLAMHAIAAHTYAQMARLLRTIRQLDPAEADHAAGLMFEDINDPDILFESLWAWGEADDLDMESIASGAEAEVAAEKAKQ